MTERSYFDSQSDDPFETPLDGSSEQAGRFANEFACARRMVDLTSPALADEEISSGVEESHTLEHDTEAEQPWPSHPEILELLETLLDANPELTPAKEAKGCEQPYAVYLPENYEPA